MFPFPHRDVTGHWHGHGLGHLGIRCRISRELQMASGASIHPIASVERYQALLQRLFGDLLQAHIERGLDGKTTAIERRWAVLLLEVLTDILDEIEGFMHPRWGRVQRHGLLFCRLRLLWGEIACLYHSAQDMVAPLHTTLEVF